MGFHLMSLVFYKTFYDILEFFTHPDVSKWLLKILSAETCFLDMPPLIFYCQCNQSTWTEPRSVRSLCTLEGRPCSPIRWTKLSLHPAPWGSVYSPRTSRHMHKQLSMPFLNGIESEEVQRTSLKTTLCDGSFLYTIKISLLYYISL